MTLMSTADSGLGLGPDESPDADLQNQDRAGVKEQSSSTTTIATKDSSSPFQSLVSDITTNEQYLKDIMMGRRIGFYKIRESLCLEKQYYTLLKYACARSSTRRNKMGSPKVTHGQKAAALAFLHTERVAIKILDKTKLDENTQRLLSREISSMEQLRHPNIIRLYEVVDTLAKLYMVLEYAGHGELFTRITDAGRLTEPTARHIFAQIVSAVEHMHKMNVIHRDLKAENIFFANSAYLVKVGDFGFSTYVQSKTQQLTTFCGSPPYAAPELFQDDWYHGEYVDIWAMGILLYFMMTGVMPFRAETVTKLKRVILEGIYSIPNYVASDCQHLIRRILRHVPCERYSIEEIKKSDWLKDVSYPQEVKRKFQLNPSPSRLRLEKDEEEARQVLEKQYGIDDNKLVECMQNSKSMSSITGTYRIVLHAVQKRRKSTLTLEEDCAVESAIFSQMPNLAQSPSSTRSTKSPGGKQTSKLCTIL